MLLAFIVSLALGAPPKPGLPFAIAPDQLHPESRVPAAALAHPTVAACHRALTLAAEPADDRPFAERRATALTACAPLLGGGACAEGLRSSAAQAGFPTGLLACCQGASPPSGALCDRSTVLDDRESVVLAVAVLAGRALEKISGVSLADGKAVALSLAYLTVPPDAALPDALRRPAQLCEVSFNPKQPGLAAFSHRDGKVEVVRLSRPATVLQGTQLAARLIALSSVLRNERSKPRLSAPCAVLLEGGDAAVKRPITEGLRAAGLTVYFERSEVPPARTVAQPPRWIGWEIADREERLVSEARRLVSERGAVARSPELQQALAALEQPAAEYESWPEPEKKACRAAADAASALPKRCAEELERGRPALARLRAARAGAAASPLDGFDVLADPKAPGRERSWLGLQHGARLAAWEIASLVRAGKPDEAVPVCLDALRFGRDAMTFTGFMGATVGSAIETLVLGPCARALDLSATPGKAKACAELAQVRLTLPRFSAAVAHEEVAQMLSSVGPLLDAPHRAALPAEAQAVVKRQPEIDPAVERTLRETWPRFLGLWDAMIGAADLPPEERTRAFAAARDEYQRGGSLLAAFQAPDFSAVGDRRDRAVAALDLLVEACRLDAEHTTAWPKPSLPEVVDAKPPANGPRIRLVARSPGEPLSVEVTADRR